MSTQWKAKDVFNSPTSSPKQRMYTGNSAKRQIVRVIPEWLEKNASLLEIRTESLPHSVNDPGKSCIEMIC